MKFNDAREAAALYLDMGFRVVPLYGVTAEGCECGSPACKPRDWGKHCADEVEARWKDGEPFEASDFAPSDNIALAMGPWGGSDEWLVALDVDGREALSYWFPGVPPTLSARTPRGSHHVFAVPAYAPLGNWVDVCQDKPHGGPSLDLRYARGRIVVAPSRGYSGAYEWTLVREPARLPEHVVESILDRRRARGLEVLEAWERKGKRP